MTICQLKASTGSEAKKRNYSRQHLRKMLNVDWLEELRVGIQFLTGPNIPAGSVALGWMSKRIDWLLADCGECDANFDVQRAGLELGSDASAECRLNIVHAALWHGVLMTGMGR